MFVWLKYRHSSSLCKQKFFCWSLKIRTNMKFWNILIYWDSVHSLWGLLLTLLVVSRIIRKFHVTYYWFPKISREEFLIADNGGGETFRPNRYVNASYERPILEQFMGNGSAALIASKQNSTKSTTKTKKPMQIKGSLHSQTSCYQAKFAVYLWTVVRMTSSFFSTSIWPCDSVSLPITW